MASSPRNRAAASRCTRGNKPGYRPLILRVYRAMKPDVKSRQDIRSAAIVQSFWLILACCGLFALTAYASDPSWWSTPGPNGAPSAIVPEQVVTNNGVVTTNYITNDYAVITQGQLKQFTVRAVDYLNANLTDGAGTNLNSMISNWAADYATNGYATNPANPTRPYEPSDFQVENVGQVKYIGNLVWSQLVAAGYTNAAPSWLEQDTNTDHAVANVGQLKEVFNFDLNLSNVTAALNSDGSVTINWSVISGNSAPITISGQNADGSWTTLGTVSANATSDTLSASVADQYQALSASTSAQTFVNAAGNLSTIINLLSTLNPDGSVTLTWDLANNENGSQITIAGEDADGNWTPLGTVDSSTTSFTVPASEAAQYTSLGVSNSFINLIYSLAIGAIQRPTPPPPQYAVIDLGASNVPIKITDSGYVLYSTSSNSITGYSVWYNGQTPLPLQPIDPATPNWFASDIGEDGTVVGIEDVYSSANATASSNGDDYIDPSTPSGSYGDSGNLAVWSPGTATPTLTPPQIFTTPPPPGTNAPTIYWGSYQQPGGWGGEPNQGPEGFPNVYPRPAPMFVQSGGGTGPNIWDIQICGATTESGTTPDALADGFENARELGSVFYTYPFSSSSNTPATLYGTAKFPLALNNSTVVQCLTENDTYNGVLDFSSPSSTTYSVGGATLPTSLIPLGNVGTLSNESTLGNYYVLGLDYDSGYVCWDGSQN